MSTIEEKLIFGLSNDAEGNAIVLVGVPAAAWEYMKDGKTHTIDFTKVGLPLRLIVYGGITHDEVKSAVDQYNAKHNIAALDLRREDFSIPPKD